MTLDSEEIHYKVWASDNVVYGPVLLVTLLEWVADGRVTPGTWVFSEEVNSWKPAKTLPALGDALAELPRQPGTTPQTNQTWPSQRLDHRRATPAI